MIGLCQPLAVPVARIPWDQIEASMASFPRCKPRMGRFSPLADLFGSTARGSRQPRGDDHPPGGLKSLTNQQCRWLKRCQAIEPVIGHLKDDHGMRRCCFQGQAGDALNAVLAAAVFKLRWLMRAIVAKGDQALHFLRLL